MEARQVRGLARPAFQEESPGARVQARGFEPAEESLCEQEFPTKPSTDFPGKNHLQPVWPGGWCVQLSTGVCDVGATVGGIHRPVASYCPVPPAVLSPVPRQARPLWDASLRPQRRAARRPGCVLVVPASGWSSPGARRAFRRDCVERTDPQGRTAATTRGLGPPPHIQQSGVMGMPSSVPFLRGALRSPRHPLPTPP